MKVLLTNHYAQAFTGSEINALQLGQALIASGHTVDVATFFVGSPMREKFEAEGMNVFNLLQDNSAPMAYDVIWAHHAPVLTQLLFKRTITDAKILFSSLGPLEPLEAPPIFLDAIHYYLVNSDSNRIQLMSYGIPEEKIHFFPNFAPQQFFQHAKRQQAAQLRKIGVISNHPPAELRDFAEIARSQGLLIDFIGLQDRPVFVDEHTLLPYDLIVTIGKTVQYCFALKVPVYCYDHFGGPGYIQADNYQLAKKYNFSGRGFDRKLTALELFEDVTQNYIQATATVDYLYQQGETSFCLEKNLESVLTEIDQISITNIDSFRQQCALAGRINDYYVRELKHRLIIEAQSDQKSYELYLRD